MPLDDERPTRRQACLAMAASLAGLSTACASRTPEDPRPLRIDGPAGALRVDDGGSGAAIPVLFAHGFAGDRREWDAQLDLMRAMRRAIAFDFRGHGESAVPVPPAYAVSDFAQDIAAVADALTLPPFVLIGHGLGASAAIAYAANNPSRVAGLVLIGVTGRVPAEQSVPMMDALRNDFTGAMQATTRRLVAGGTPENAARLTKQIAKVPREVALPILAGVWSFDPVPLLRAYPGPKLIVDTPHGDGAASLSRQVPEVPRHRIDNTSHWPQLDMPRTLNRALDDFLAKVPSP